jgi:hypothetical protein
MIADNLILATNSMRSSVSSLKKKLSNLKVQVEFFDAEIEKIEGKFDRVTTEASIYKSRLERDMGREVRRLERELDLLRKNASKTHPEGEEEQTDSRELRIASAVAIIESILRAICEGADDFRLMSEAFLFPAVIERIMAAEVEAYLLKEVPVSAHLVVQRGREHVQWVREEYDTHLTDPEAWGSAIDYVTEWWRNDALPMIYGSRDDQWEIDVPLTLEEMLQWRDCPAERPITFSPIFDAYETFRNNKDVVYESTGLRQFELKNFTFTSQ